MLNIRNFMKVAGMAAIALAAFSCSQEEFEGTEVKGVTLNATFEKPATRTSVNDNNEVVWNKDDAFALFYTERNETKKAKFSTVSADGTSTSATFSSSDMTTTEGITPMYAVFPYQDGASISGNTLTMTLESSISAEKRQYSNGAMIATVQDMTSSISFRHLAGLLKLTLNTNIPTDAHKLVITADKPISGNFTATLGGSEEPTLSSTSTTNADKQVEIILGLSQATTEPTVFYLPIPANTYGSIKAELQKEDGTALYTAKEWTDITVARAEMLTATFGFVSLDASTETNLSNAIQNALPSTEPETPQTTMLEITNTLDATNNEKNSTLILPVLANSNIGLVFTEVPTTATNQPLTLKDKSQTATAPMAAVNTLSVSIPEIETNTEAPVLVINMPRTTVSLEAADETKGTTYGDVTSTTATSTLVVGHMVTITKLTVKGGNIKLNGKATISQLIKGEDAPAVVYIIKGTDAGEAVLPETLPAGFEVVASETELALRQAATNGGNVTMDEDVTLTTPLVVSGTMTLDLNGHALKAAAEGLTQVLNTKDGVVLVRRGAELTVNDSSNGSGSIHYGSSATVYTAVKLTDSNDTGSKEAKLTVNGGKLTGYYYGISGNGTRHGTSVTVNGGVITGEKGSGIYHPQEGTLNISGGEITGAETGVELRSGTLNLTGGTLKCTATEFKIGANGNGTTIIGAALGISQHTTNKAIQANISGGTLEGFYALYEEDVQDKSHTNISVAESGNCVFKGKVYSENSPAFIGGGTFHDASALNFLGANANVKVQLQADNTIPGFKTKNGQTVEIDLNNHELTLKDPTVGSTGTETNSCQLLQGSTVTFKNGTLTSNNTYIMIQNYCNLTLKDMTVNGSQALYVVSNNCGNVVIENTTLNGSNAANHYAFDVCGYASYPGVSVTVKGTSVINGKVEISKSASNTGTMALNIEGGEFKGDLKIDESITDAASIIKISGTPTFTGSSWDTYNKQ